MCASTASSIWLCPKDSLVARHQVDLKEWADLRNAIVHEKTRRHIARPFIGTGRKIERIAKLLRSPPLLRQVLGRQRVQVADSGEPVGNALNVMYHHRFSQMTVVAGTLHTAITAAPDLFEKTGQGEYRWRRALVLESSGWMMRTNRNLVPWLWSEVKAGRLRQGWGSPP